MVLKSSKPEFSVSKIVFKLFVIVLIILAIYFIIPFNKDYLLNTNESIKVYDDKDRLLFEFLDKNGFYYEYLNIDEVPKRYIYLLLISEDKRFYSHIGFDILSILRATYDNLFSSKIKSGASTITQQVIKLKKNIKRNNLFTKLLEILESVKLELYFSKKEILEYYINNVRFGNNIRGFKKASLIYFNKKIDELNLKEYLYLIIILKSPTIYNPYKNIFRLEKKVKEYMNYLLIKRIIDENEYNIYKDFNIDINYNKLIINAPHFCFYVLNEVRKIVKNERIKEIRTYFDLDLYNEVLRSAIKKSEEIKKKHNANDTSIVMIDNRSNTLKVMIGSLDFYSETGQNNGVTSKRQHGSVIKPFTYALALETKKYTPSSILLDKYLEFNNNGVTFIPRNYDNIYRGRVNFATALASSYNVPAVYLLDRIGYKKLYILLTNIGVKSLIKKPEYYGLGLTLGNADMTLLELANAYTIFPDNGYYNDLKVIKSIKTEKKEYNITYSGKRKIISEETAFLINHILSEYRYKVDGFGVNSSINMPYNFAIKTGTTKNFRDNTIIAYNNNWTIGVWTGNFSGEPMKDLPAVSGSGIILRQIIFDLIEKKMINNEKFSSNNLNIIEKRICGDSGLLASDQCRNVYNEYFIKGTEPKEECSGLCLKGVIKTNINENKSLRIVKPIDGSIYQIDYNISEKYQQITFESDGEENDIEWWTNGAFFKKGNRVVFNLKNGEHIIELKKNNITQDRVKIYVE